jgi:membrane associated rhomboid family serine protease
MTVPIILVTAIVSYIGFQKRDFFARFLFNPYQVFFRREWHRMLTHGFLHADWLHLIINMMVLWSFGLAVEQYFSQLTQSPGFVFLLFYLIAIVVSSLPTLWKHKEDYHYNAVGASGAVSAVLFASILFNPWQKVYFYGILGVPGILMGVGYLWYSRYMAIRANDNINHDAHFFGAVFGFVFPLFLEPRLIIHFLKALMSFSF